MELNIVKWFQSFRTPFLDWFFITITELGDEMVFFILIAVLYWVFNKKFAYRLMLFYLTSVMFNDVLKNVIQRPRPFDISDQIVSVVPKTHGYALPSGHAQSSMMLALTLNDGFKTFFKWVTPLLFTLAALVSISRLYLGQHYLTDVLLGMGLAVLIFTLLRFLSTKISISATKIVYMMIPLMILLMIWIQDKNLYISIAAMIGATIGYDLEQRYLDVSIKKVWYVQILKVVIGLSLALLIRAGLKMILPYPEDPYQLLSLLLDVVRYFVLGLWLTLGSMFIFKKLFK